MTIPKFSELFTDVLDVLTDGAPMRRKDVFVAVVARQKLTDLELAEKLKSGWNRAEDRVHWATAYLYYAGAIQKPSRGFIQINRNLRQRSSSSEVTDLTLLRILDICLWMKSESL